MLILCVRTDKPETELYLYNDRTLLGKDVWVADRQLAETLHTHIHSLLGEHGANWDSIEGAVVYRGPGSFTGLRIGIAVANAIATDEIPIVGAQGEDWTTVGISKLLEGKNDRVVTPEYGAPVHITTRKA